MDYEIRLLDSSGIYFVETAGKMCADGFILLSEELLRQPNWSPGNNVLFDHRKLDFSSAGIQDLFLIRSFHRNNEEKIGCGKSAILLKPGASLKWHELWANGEKIRTANRVKIFENYEEAVRWLKEEAG